MTTPALTVLIAVYNGEQHLSEAVESILTQDFGDFEFLIIDDASTDATPELLAEYAKKDVRIRVERNFRNIRLAASLNRGIGLAKAPLIARMDADDVSCPGRLSKQVDYMRANPDICVCGSAVRIYENEGEVWMPALDNHSIRAGLFFDSHLYHPTVIYRKALVERFKYSESTLLAQDYELWTRMAEERSVRFANLAEPLLRYRFYVKHSNVAYKEKQGSIANAVRLQHLRRAGLEPMEKEFAPHMALASRSSGLSLKMLWACKIWLTKLYRHVATSGLCDAVIFNEELKKRWLLHFLRNRSAPLSYAIYLSSEFCDISAISSKIAAKLRYWQS